MKKTAPPRRISWLALMSLAVLAGCRDPKPASYRIPKEKDTGLMTVTAPGAQPATAPADMPAGHPPIDGATTAAAPLASASAGGNGPAMGGGMGGMAAMGNSSGLATAAGPGLGWRAPANWAMKPGNGMRKGSFTITGPDGATADLAITAFPGDVGGEVANVNRWRGQLSLAPLSPAEAAAAVTHLSANGLDIGVVDLVNTASPAQRMLGAMIPYQGATWFFKLTGPDSVVAPERAAYLDFLKTIQPADTAAAPTTP